MSGFPSRRIRASLAGLALLAASIAGAGAPLAARADSVLVVSNVAGECPDAGYSSLEKAIEYAQSHDTIRICPGTYVVGPAEGQAPLPANGLTIDKSLTIIGAGAHRVTIEPAGPLATATTNPRGNAGSIVMVKNTKPGSTSDVDVNVTIEGVTIKDAGHRAAAGVQFNNAVGTITDSQVGPFSGSPSPVDGWGVIASDDEAVTPFGAFERNVSVSNDLITGYGAGGVLVDGSESADPFYFRSGITTNAAITGNLIEGAAGAAEARQYGIQINAGARATITGNQITGNLGATPGTADTPGSGVGILLSDADVSSQVPGARSGTYYTTIGSNNLFGNGYGIFNGTPAFEPGFGSELPYQTYVNGTEFAPTAAELPPTLTNTTEGNAIEPITNRYDIAGFAVRAATPAGNWYGSATGPVGGAPSTATVDGVSEASASPSDQDSVIYENVATAPYAKPVVPAPIADLPPVASWGTPVAGEALIAGRPEELLALASDDFGVDSVKLEIDGTLVATIDEGPYATTWTPPVSLIGQTVTLTAIAEDEAGQTGTTSEQVKIVEAPHEKPEEEGHKEEGHPGPGGGGAPLPPHQLGPRHRPTIRLPARFGKKAMFKIALRPILAGEAVVSVRYLLAHKSICTATKQPFSCDYRPGAALAGKRTLEIIAVGADGLTAELSRRITIVPVPPRHKPWGYATSSSKR